MNDLLIIVIVFLLNIIPIVGMTIRDTRETKELQRQKIHEAAKRRSIERNAKRLRDSQFLQSFSGDYSDDL